MDVTKENTTNHHLCKNSKRTKNIFLLRGNKELYCIGNKQAQ